jgi:hypothetical protein
MNFTDLRLGISVRFAGFGGDQLVLTQHLQIDYGLRERLRSSTPLWNTRLGRSPSLPGLPFTESWKSWNRIHIWWYEVHELLQALDCPRRSLTAFGIKSLNCMQDAMQPRFNSGFVSPKGPLISALTQALLTSLSGKGSCWTRRSAATVHLNPNSVQSLRGFGRARY